MSSKIQNRIKIEASPDQVWAVLGDLARASEYVPGVVAAKVEDGQRLCTDTYGNEIREEISDYSDEQRSYAFKHLQVPLPVKWSQGKFKIEAEEKDSLVVLEWEFEPMDPVQEAEVTPMLDSAAKMTLENLRQRVEAAGD
jgi:ribosome-associated toxin RatA of RatAB toxin-antitoxin module